jgi:ferrous iron transport protein B
MDRLMRTMGLHGRSFIPMLMGFGCNVPALLGARTLENRRDRILTMLLIPLMSCSARLPVYVMVTAAFFPRSGGLVIFGLYLTGTVAAMVLGRVFGKTILKGGAAPFVLELPPYRWPTPKTTLTILRMTFLMYLKRIAGVVVIFAALIWFLGNYPREPHPQAGAAGAALYPPDTSVSFQTAEDQAYGHHTLIYGMGRFIEPAFRPLGFTLPMDIALIAGFFAKEVVVSTLGVLLTGSDASGNATLVENLRRQIPSPAAALAFLVFVLLYTPCLTTIATLHKEVGQKRWTIFAILYQTAAAYLAALLVYNVARLAGMG